jgi:hypothetical protein
MEYARVDENLPDGRKMMCVPDTERDAALGLFTAALCWASRNESDGFIPAGFFHTEHRRKLRDLLVSVRLFDPAENGSEGDINIHDYLDYNRSKSQIADIRSKRRAAGSKGGRKQKPSKPKANDKQVASELLKQTEPIDKDKDKDIKSVVALTQVDTGETPHTILRQCNDELLAAFGTFPTPKNRERLDILCSNYPDAALTRIRFGIAKAKEAGKPTVNYAIACAESASIQELSGSKPAGCPSCGGEGELNGSRCPACVGTGRNLTNDEWKELTDAQT